MTEKDLGQFGLLDEFSITELEQRLEFEAWCDLLCTSNDRCPAPNTGCIPVENALCVPDELCTIDRP